MLNPQHPPFIRALKKATKMPIYVKGVLNSILTGILTEVVSVKLYTKLWWLFFNSDDWVDLTQASITMATKMQTLCGVFHSFKIYQC